MRKLKRNAIAKQGDLAFLRLAQAFGVDSDNSTATVSIATAKEVIRQVTDVVLADAEANTLLAWLDRNGERVITPSELLGALRVQHSALRRSIVARLWESFEQNARAFDSSTAGIAVDAVINRFDPSCHPLVLQGKAASGDVEAQVADFFSNAAALSGPGKVTKGLGIEAFFATIGAEIPLDSDFAAMVAACWGLPGFDVSVAVQQLQAEDNLHAGQSHNAPALQAGMTVDVKASVLLTMTMQRALDEMLQHHRKCLLLQPQQHSSSSSSSSTHHARAAYRVLGTSLRAADAVKSGFLSRGAFVEVLQSSSRLYVSYEPVLDLFDRNRDRSVDYRHYLAALVGELAPSRRICAERLWQQFPRDGTNCVPVAEIHRRFLENNSKSSSHGGNSNNALPAATALASRGASESLKQKQLRDQFSQMAANSNTATTTTNSSASTSANDNNNNNSSRGNLAQAGELALFLDSWDMRKQHGVVTSFELLCEWFVPLSATIEQDSYFIDYLRKHWGLKN